jgi:peptide-methionine (R)-S-oxide reductase
MIVDSPDMKVNKTDAEWQKILAPDVFQVTRRSATERPFSGKYDNFFEDGNYYCSNCRNYLFNSNDKFDAGCGWPSFSATAEQESITTHTDPGNMFIPDRTEVRCASCGAHLGHVFDDGPQPTGLRYCMNSLALDFKASDDKK